MALREADGYEEVRTLESSRATVPASPDALVLRHSGQRAVPTPRRRRRSPLTRVLVGAYVYECADFLLPSDIGRPMYVSAADRVTLRKLRGRACVGRLGAYGPVVDSMLAQPKLPAEHVEDRMELTPPSPLGMGDAYEIGRTDMRGALVDRLRRRATRERAAGREDVARAFDDEATDIEREAAA